MATTELSTKTKSAQVQKPQIKDLLQGEEFRRQVAKVLPRHITAERFARVALTATYKTPKLLDCSPQSLLRCLIELSAIGLEPDGRRSHLIPFRDNRSGTMTCTLIIDYKGIAELLRRNAEVAYIHSDVVYEKDFFDYRFGTGGKLEHVPAEGDRGAIRRAYSFIRLKDGTEEFDVMGVEEIEKVRKRSKTPNDGPWVTDWNEMAKKTVFRRLSKTLPLSPQVRDAIESEDDEPLTENERFIAAKPATVASSSSRSRLPKPSSTVGPDLEQQEDQDNNSSEPKPEPETASDIERVREFLATNGYTEAELIEVLRIVRWVTDKKSANTLEEVSPDALAAVVQDPENTLVRLSKLRANATGEQK